jgi:hypothetical protein
VAAGLRKGVTVRALVIGFLLVPLNVLFIVKALWVWGAITGAESLFTNTIGSLFLLAAGNEGLKRWRPRWVFSTGELLTIYLLLGISTGLTCSIWDLGGSLATYASHLFWFANDQNGWEKSLWPYVPTWLTVRDRAVIEGFYVGSSTAYVPAVLRAWGAVALAWAGLIGTTMWVSLCLNSIVRRRWADEEKLAFPMTVLPLQLTDSRFALLRNKLFWTGFAVAGGIGAWNILAALLPALPQLPMRWNFAASVENNPPWNFLRFYDLLWSPWYLGLCYLIPLDLAFSLFVFNLLWSAQYVVSGHYGWCINKWSGFPYGDQQTAGGFIAIAAVTIWLDRKYLARVVRSALNLEARLSGEQDEALSYRAAAMGMLSGLLFLWWLLHLVGLSTWVTLAILANYFLMVMVICRVRAQLGPPSHQLYGAMPSYVLPTLVGSRALGARTMGLFYILRPLLEEQRNQPAPLQLEGFKMADAGTMDRRRLGVAMAIVPVLAIISYFWASIHIGYHTGMASGQAPAIHVAKGGWDAEWLRDVLANPSGPDTSGSLAMAFSFGVTLALYALKLQYQWWPLHPVAYPIAMNNRIANILPALFAAWLVKALLLRYGGLRAHRTALPVFLGLIAGDAVKALLAALLFLFVGGGRAWNPWG